jgi:hypothetical protein
MPKNHDHHRCKRSVYLEEMEEIREQAARLGVPISRVVQDAWRIAKDEIAGRAGEPAKAPLLALVRVNARRRWTHYSP